MRLGLIAAARITPKAVIVPAREVERVEVVAVAARDPRRAREFAERFDVPRVESSYDDLVAAADIDAVYIATPAAHHRRWTVAAVEHGKHVLCEKPLGANAADAEAMVDAARAADRVLVEAYHWRYHPLADRVTEIVASGRLGELREVSGTFVIPRGGIPRSDIRWDLALGGGALMDLGCYALQWCRLVAGDEPEVVSAKAMSRVKGVDSSMVAELRFSESVTGQIQCSMDDPERERMATLRVVGTEGELMVFNPLAPQIGNLLILTTADGEEHESVEQTSTYVHQLVAFRDAVASGAPALTGGEDSISTMRLIDRIYEQSGLGPRPSAR